MPWKAHSWCAEPPPTCPSHICVTVLFRINSWNRIDQAPLTRIQWYRRDVLGTHRMIWTHRMISSVDIFRSMLSEEWYLYQFNAISLSSSTAAPSFFPEVQVTNTPRSKSSSVKIFIIEDTSHSPTCKDYAIRGLIKSGRCAIKT